jgi:biotin operon repressor
MIVKTDKVEVRKRLKTLYMLMQERRTLDELAEGLGRTKKQVHKDIGKLGMQGCIIGSNKGKYWIEV